MKFTRFSKPVAALLLAVSLVSVGVTAPADAAPARTTSAKDTGWDLR